MIREELADLYQDQENWSEAAAMLKGIPMDSGTRIVPGTSSSSSSSSHNDNASLDDYKVKIYIKIVRLYLEDEDSVNADAYLNRAAMLNPQDKV